MGLWFTKYFISNGFQTTVSDLKTEEVKIVIKPVSKGLFTMKPRILYLDEAGKYKSHEPEPVRITVKELGISGWIRGKDD